MLADQRRLKARIDTNVCGNHIGMYLYIVGQNRDDLGFLNQRQANRLHGITIRENEFPNSDKKLNHK